MGGKSNTMRGDLSRSHQHSSALCEQKRATEEASHICSGAAINNLAARGRLVRVVVTEFLPLDLNDL